MTSEGENSWIIGEFPVFPVRGMMRRRDEREKWTGGGYHGDRCIYVCFT